MKTLFPPNPPNPTEFICTHQRLWKLRGHVADLSWTSSDHFWKLSFSDFRTHFCSVSMHLKIWAKMQHICPTSQPSALLMPTRCHQISVRRLRRKSMGTLRTCPDVPWPFLKTFIFVFSDTFLLKNGVSWDFDTFCPEMWDFVIYICYKKKWPPMWQLFSAKIKLALD